MSTSIIPTTLLHLVAIIFVVMNVSQVTVAGFDNVTPLFDLMAIFYFAVFKNVFGIWFVFLLGIWNDALNENLLGVTSLCYILLIKSFSALNNKMFVTENFKHVFGQFVIFCFLFLFIKWVILSVVNSSNYSIVTPLVQLVLSSSFYVLMHKFFDFLSEKLLEK